MDTRLAFVLFIAGVLTAPAHADTTIQAATQSGPYKSVAGFATWQQVPVNAHSPLLGGFDPQAADVSEQSKVLPRRAAKIVNSIG